MARSCAVRTVLIIIVLVSVKYTQEEVLTPPYFNLAEGRPIEASATCGEGVSEPEAYCKLTGANPEDLFFRHESVVKGQLCDVCDISDPEKQHPPHYATDGSQRWWQSPPLSRGMEYNEINVTIDLGQEFHVAYVYIRMANSPRPGVWALERSVDLGETYLPWQYFADTNSDCQQFFSMPAYEPIVEDDDVICVTEYSKVIPLEGGEIPVRLLVDRPNARNFSHSPALQRFTEATNIRLRLLRTKTLQGHLMSVARQDPTVTRRYFYSIKDISVGGRCVCNGHADVCDKTDPENPLKLLCRCQHNTCGAQCEYCCPGFVQKVWRRATEESSNECEPCNCHGHSNECIYDPEMEGKSLDIHGNYEGGGVCQNCQYNTAGINCETCADGYYRPYGVLPNDTYACRPCDCDLRFSTGSCAPETGQCECRENFVGENCDSCNAGYYGYPDCWPCDCNSYGTLGDVCHAGGGNCPCKYNFDGPQCDQCAAGFYQFPDCLPCNCSQYGAINQVCDLETGQCPCDNRYTERACDACRPGTWNYPNCDFCQCDLAGVTHEVCDVHSGWCICKDGYTGSNCERCDYGYFGFPECVECGCDPEGSEGEACNVVGQCRCKVNFSGEKCDRCASGFYDFPSCTACNCDLHGSWGSSCNDAGQCTCRYNFAGLQCNSCKDGFYNYPLCEECNCDPAGVSATFEGCDSVAPGQLCECKERVTGRICDQCKPLYWNLRANNPDGCQECDCWLPGTLSGYNVCSGSTGQCLCKPYVTSRRCDQCMPGTYSLEESNLFGCQPCECDIGGSDGTECDIVTGQCRCRPRVDGRACDYPMTNHYFPTLFQHQYEIEDGKTPSGSSARFAYYEDVFPDYSWRGYAIFSRTQPEVLLDLSLEKPNIYLLLYRYVNRGFNTIKAVTEVASDTEGAQKGYLDLRPASYPTFGIVSTSDGDPYLFVLNAGEWTVSTMIPDLLDPVFVDYFVLLPSDYFEARMLRQDVLEPCSVENSESCRMFVYPRTTQFSIARGETGYVGVNNERMRVALYPDTEVLEILDSSGMAWLNENQTSMYLDLVTAGSGTYILMVNYYMPDNERTDTLSVDVTTAFGTQAGKAVLYDCKYRTLCRAVVLDMDGKAAEYDVTADYISLTLQGSADVNAAIDSVVAIPLDDWSLDYLKPHFQCIKGADGLCQGNNFRSFPSSYKFEVEAGYNAERKLPISDYPGEVFDLDTGLIYLDADQEPLDVTGTVTKRGTYNFIVHFYQPKYPTFDVDVTVNIGDGISIHEAFLPTPFCSAESGCRAIIEMPNGEFEFDIDANFTLTFLVPGEKSIFIDYVLAVPSTGQKPNLEEEGSVDKSARFISDCIGNDDFNIDPNVQGWCRDAVFSLTTDYNNGALQCDCNIDGSLSFQCEEFGGRCFCKDYVIGRTCSQCQSGYYGFPDCQSCDCPNGVCEETTGACICPPHVTGEQCNICLPETFGYDPFIGCEECKCEFYGVVDGNMECDLITGQCNCKDHVVGRQCDTCEIGFYAYPHCVECSCNLQGVTEEICEQGDGSCICKENVEGERCDACTAGSYNLEEDNFKGCTSCFCFGITKSCSSSDWALVEIIDMEGWNVTNLVDPRVDNYGEMIRVLVLNAGIDVPEEASYWVAPESYLGNKVTSYGTRLTYTILHMLPEDMDTYRVITADVILTGRNMSLFFTNFDQPEPNKEMELGVKLVETNFVHADGTEATREQLMMVLSHLDALLIRATYYTITLETRMTNVSLPLAMEDVISVEQAVSVEKCQCPHNYIGSSCEACAPGYYRIKEGPYLGVCVPCICHGHASTCDPETGQCIDCRNNTRGHQCELCAVGYYGDATYGTEYDCAICSCPLPTISNNFAATCTPINGAGFTDLECECIEGYKGFNCEECAPGYYGEPTIPGGNCTMCECNDNLDMSAPVPCNPRTGECIACANNSYGPACSRCEPGYYGDAIIAKNCKQCSCDMCGTIECNFENGLCECQPGVTGANCDRCERNMYGFHSCQGCMDCNCSVASVSNQCNMTSGECECQPGVTGRTCDRCMNGFWNYSPYGCQKCDCDNFVDSGTICDQETGQCRCLPGVIGEKCDMCDEKWVFIDNVGCQPCDVCTHVLIDDISWLEDNVTGILTEIEDISIGVYAQQRLRRAEERATQLRPLVDGIVTDPTQVDLYPLQHQLTFLDDKSKSVKLKADGTLAEMDDSNSHAASMKIKAREMERNSSYLIPTVNNAVVYVQQLRYGIIAGTLELNADAFIAEAENMLNEIKARSFDSARNQTNDELDMCEEAVNKSSELVAKTSDLDERIAADAEELAGHAGSFREMMNITLYANEQIRTAQITNQRNMENPVYEKITMIEETVEDIEAKIPEAEETLDEARNLLENATTQYEGVASLKPELDGQTEELGEKADSLNDTVPDSTVEEAQARADELSEQAQQLSELSAKATDPASDAIKAAEANLDIVATIEAAMLAADEGIASSQNATALSDGLSEEAEESNARSSNLLANATDVQERANSGFSDKVKNANNELDQVEKTYTELSPTMEDIKSTTATFESDEVTKQANEADATSSKAFEQLNETTNNIHDTVDEVPAEKERAEKITKEITEADIAVARAKVQVDQVKRIVPESEVIIDDIWMRKEVVVQLGKDLADKIAQLRDKVDMAREKANSIKVGMKFFANTTLEVSNPEQLVESVTHSQVSMYFKSAESNALLVYIGNEASEARRFKREAGVITNDFMSIEIINGKCVLKYELGSGVTEVINDKLVNDNQWHLVVAERNGKMATLTVHTEDEPEVTVEGASEGQFTSLNFNLDTAHMYVGGAPADAKLQRELVNRRFVGCVEGVSYNNEPVGLWNFRRAENIDGCMERDQLKTLQTGAGYKFDGSGYLVISRGSFNPEDRSTISFSFKTFAENGILFYAGKERDFLSVEVQDGRVLFQYDMGGGRAQLETQDMYNDGKWYTVEASRFHQEGLLKIDGIEVANGTAPGDLKKLAIGEEIYIGGFLEPPSVSNVGTDGFVGCIKQLQLGTLVVDLNKNIQSRGVMPGCPDVIARLASFDKTQDSYLKLSLDDDSSEVALSFKFRTLKPDGVLFYSADAAQQYALSAQLSEGRLYFVHKDTAETILIQSNNDNYNDGDWHFVNMFYQTKDDDTLGLLIDVDEVDRSEKTLQEADWSKLAGNIWIGGTSADYGIQEGNAVTVEALTGCLGDLTINGLRVNFAEVEMDDRPSVALEHCPLDDITEATELPFEVEEYPHGPCVLPLRPNKAATATSGRQFGLSESSRQEFNSLPDKFRKRSQFQFEFRTGVADGVVFYMADDRHRDFMAVYFANGQLHFDFNCGSGPAKLSSTKLYNDNNWHIVKFQRNFRTGILIIDSEEVAKGKSKGNSNSLNVDAPYYVGGLAPDMAEKAKKNTMVTSSFNGCIRNFKLNDKALEDLSFEEGVSACADNTEPGTFFSVDGGHIVLYDKFKVGLDFDIQLEVKPRSMSGIIMYIAAADGGDFLALQLHDGNLTFSADNGGRTLSATFQPDVDKPKYLCDGNWHSIQAVKAKNLVTLSVDGVLVNPDIGQAAVTSTDTDDPLYIGGIPDIPNAPGILTDEHFVGCIRDVYFEQKIQTLADATTVVGGVTLNSCPTT